MAKQTKSKVVYKQTRQTEVTLCVFGGLSGIFGSVFYFIFELDIVHHSFFLLFLPAFLCSICAIYISRHLDYSTTSSAYILIGCSILGLSCIGYYYLFPSVLLFLCAGLCLFKKDRKIKLL
ncbi:hypothetical protein [Pseudalkalibacillus caeni]|uniref:DUF4064 domain-containing protein n=1 Tax=Exobacillus caeni TaxID=2574798 RepID=A0A5R9F0Z8_9BACL|nr:hypothetical protein [Pseudalkalibacillus caeni]TLS37237.1 hypothetical protein FCL54_11980 [Pseudalkalibacillus caeni]